MGSYFPEAVSKRKKKKQKVSNLPYHYAYRQWIQLECQIRHGCGDQAAILEHILVGLVIEGKKKIALGNVKKYRNTNSDCRLKIQRKRK